MIYHPPLNVYAYFQFASPKKDAKSTRLVELCRLRGFKGKKTLLDCGHEPEHVNSEASLVIILRVSEHADSMQSTAQGAPEPQRMVVLLHAIEPSQSTVQESLSLQSKVVSAHDESPIQLNK